MYTTITTIKENCFLKSYLNLTLVTLIRFGLTVSLPNGVFSLVANDPSRVAGLWSGEDTPSSWKAVRTLKDLLRRSGARILG